MTTVTAFVFYSVYELLTLPVYLRTIYVLAKKAQFATPFYRLFIVVEILDLIGYAIRLGFYRLPIFDLTLRWFANAEKTFWLAPVRFFAFFLSVLLLLCQFGLSLNRFTAVWLPIKHEKIWKHWLKFVGICAAFSALLNFHLLFNSAYFSHLIAGDPSKGFLLSPAANSTLLPINPDPNLMTLIIGTGCWLCSFLMNLLSLAKIARMRRRGNMNSLESRNIAINLFIIALWTTMDTAAYSGYQAASYIIRGGILSANYFSQGLNNNCAMYQLYENLPWIIDLHMLTNAWVLLLVNRELRREAFPFLGRKFNNNQIGDNPPQMGTKTARVLQKPIVVYPATIAIFPK